MRLQVDPNSPSGYRLTKGDERDHVEAGDLRLRRSRNAPPIGADPRIDEVDPTPGLPPLPGQADPATIKVGTMRGEMTDDGRANAYVWSGVSWELVASNQIVESEALDVVQWRDDQNYEPGVVVMYLDPTTDEYTMWQAIERGYEGTGPPAEPGWLPISTEGSGGGTGADEVWIGPDTPADPALELWYDTDAVAPYDAAKAPRGYVTQKVQAASDMALATTGWQDIANMAHTFTPPAGPARWYRMTFVGTIKATTAGGTQLVAINNGSTQFTMQELMFFGGGGSTIPFNLTAIVQLPGGVAVTYKPQVYSNAGAMLLLGANSRASRFIIEDIGAV